MTDEYKNVLFDYLTGGWDAQPGPLIDNREVILKNRNLNFLLTLYLPEATNINVYGMIEGSNSYVIYGGYDTNTDSWLGFIALLDDSFDLIEVITEFSSGTPLRTICSLEMAEDNTFYGIDYEGSYTARFIMLNNFTIPNANNEYKVKLRTSYNFNDNDFLAQIGTKIFKNPNSSHYVFIGQTESDFTLKIIELKINVGEPNEWTSYSSSNYEYYMNGYVDFDSADNAYISTVGINQSNEIRLVYKDYTASNLWSTLIETATGDPYMYGNSPVAFIGKDKFYYIWTDDNTGNLYLKKYDNTLTQIQALNGANMYLTSKNGDLYIGFDYATSLNEGGQFYYQRYTDTWDPIGISGYRSYIKDGYMFITNNYNLLNIYVFNYSVNTLYGELITEDYNPTNFNGIPYKYTNSIYPQKVRLYSGLINNKNLVFARNIYNISASGNTYTATVEIPNIYLNNGNITPNQLISETNIVMNNDITPIDKNIYEKVYLNFINSYTSYDEDTGNNFDTTNLTKNVSSLGNDYDNSKICKLLYLGDSDQIVGEKNIPTGINSVFHKTGRLTGYWELRITKTSERYKVAFANSQNQIYAWKDISNLANGNYVLTQYIRLADIPLGDQNIVYNDNQVQFNGNDVVYYTSI